MKLLLITCVKQFKKEVKDILKKADVKTYTYKDVIGYRDANQFSMQDNWFAHDMNEGKSILFYAIMKKENIDLVFDLVTAFNNEQETLSSIHVAVTPIERSI